MLADDLGTALEIEPGAVHRVVSLVPSLTESLARTSPAQLVGATDWCVHPGGLEVERVGGTKNPRVDQVVDLAPDLVLANEEENRAEDVAALRLAGLPVWVTSPRTLPGAFTSLRRMLAACGHAAPPWWDDARRVWSNAVDGSPPWATAVVPVWRRPWQVVGRDTFAGSVLRHLGVANRYADHAERYPRIEPEQLLASRADLVVLPDEPYAFGPNDGPEDFPGLEVALVSGRHLTWYGPSLVEARDLLERQLAPARAALATRQL